MLYSLCKDVVVCLVSDSLHYVNMLNSLKKSFKIFSLYTYSEYLGMKTTEKILHKQFQWIYVSEIPLKLPRTRVFANKIRLTSLRNFLIDRFTFFLRLPFSIKSKNRQ